MINKMRSVWQAISGIEKRVNDLELKIYTLQRAQKGVAHAGENTLKSP